VVNSETDKVKYYTFLSRSAVIQNFALDLL